MAVIAIYLFRHGQTDWNAEGRMQGRADRPLNDTGRRQAADLGAKLAAEFAARSLHANDFDYVSSPLERARQTMAIVGAAVGIANWQAEPRLIELDYGRWDGLTLEQIESRFPQQQPRHRADRWTVRPEGGESFADLDARVGDWLASVKKPCVASVHAGIMRCLMKRAGWVGADAAPRSPVPQGRIFRMSGPILEIVGGGPD